MGFDKDKLDLAGAKKRFANDPFYMDVLNAKTSEEFSSALTRLGKVRGSSAVQILKQALVHEMVTLVCNGATAKDAISTVKGEILE